MIGPWQGLGVQRLENDRRETKGEAKSRKTKTRENGETNRQLSH
jgi:hypothetical protein